MQPTEPREAAEAERAPRPQEPAPPPLGRPPWARGWWLGVGLLVVAGFVAWLVYTTWFS